MLLKPAASSILVLTACAQTTASLDKAKRAFDSGNYGEAARMFEAARVGGPCEISFYLGMARYRLHQTDAALIAFEEAAKCNPGLTLANIALGDAYLERGNYPEALGAYERALRSEPENVPALRGAAAVCLKTKADGKAVALLETLVRLTPTDADSHAELGAAYYATGNQEGAEGEFRAALRLNPKSGAALLGQSNLLVRQGDEEHAIPLLRQVIALAPKAVEPRYVLGSAYNRLSRFGEAATQLEETVRLGGTDPEIYYHLARAYGGLGRADDRKTALAKFAELSRQARTDTEARRSALKLVEEAKGFVTAGDLPRALIPMEQARNLRPQDDNILFRLASLHYDLTQYAKARDEIQEALALAPSEWIYHMLLGLIEGRSGRLELSRDSLRLALRLNPSSAEAHNALGEVALHLGDQSEAEAHFRRAKELEKAAEK